VLKTSDHDFEQRCAIGFRFRLGHDATETFRKLQRAYGDSFLSTTRVFRWLKAYSKGKESIEGGWPSTAKNDENIVRVRELVRSDRRSTVRMIGERSGLIHTTVHQILTNDLETRKIRTRPKGQRKGQACQFFGMTLVSWNVSLPAKSLGFLSTTRKRSARARNVGTQRPRSFSVRTRKKGVYENNRCGPVRVALWSSNWRTKSSLDVNVQTFPNGKSPVSPGCTLRYQVSSLYVHTSYAEQCTPRRMDIHGQEETISYITAARTTNVESRTSR